MMTCKCLLAAFKAVLDEREQRPILVIRIIVGNEETY
jgi:hypothetical protein